MIDTVIQGDCLDVMADMPDECVDLVVTSPPYDNLRSYHGYTLDVPAMVEQFKRIMKPGGVIVWVVGDATVKGSETGTSFRQALMFMDAGFNLHDTMIYEKLNPIPQTHNRYEQSYEYMFVFSKGKPNTFNALTEPTIRSGKRERLHGRTVLADNACRRPRALGDDLIIKPEKYRRNIFAYGIGGETSGHPAPFPEQLAADHIISWSNEGDLVFDPMCGSGTTLKMAERLNRHWYGCDISLEYCEIARERIRIEQAQLKLW